MQPLVLYTYGMGFNPWKASPILEEFGLPYAKKSISFSDVKNPPYIKINPKGRLSAFEDSNTNITLWESGAIIEYLVEEYDTKRPLNYDSFESPITRSSGSISSRRAMVLIMARSDGLPTCTQRRSLPPSRVTKTRFVA